MTDTMTIANEILAQLGGRRFQMMTGAKNMMATDSGLQFSIGTGAKNGINKVRVTLEPSDTYKVEFFKIRGMAVKVIATHDDVYCDMLADIFTAETGFHTSL